MHKVHKEGRDRTKNYVRKHEEWNGKKKKVMTRRGRRRKQRRKRRGDSQATSEGGIYRSRKSTKKRTESEKLESGYQPKTIQPTTNNLNKESKSR
jgi:hypothetical protein